jgi:tRNA threonylcarbamoyladenosine biosynthesis protein TsaB
MILCLETATKVCSVALCKSSQTWILREENPGNHASQITCFIEEVLQTAGISIADLDAIALSNGPGSYTGLRIAASVAKGLAFASGKPLIGIPSLESLGRALYRDALLRYPQQQFVYLPLLDARRMDAYAQGFSLDAQGQWQTVLPCDCYTLSADWLRSLSQSVGKPLLLGGDALPKLRELVGEEEAWVFSPIVDSSASHLAAPAQEVWERGEFLDTAYFEPFYLKMPNITSAAKHWTDL